MKLRKILLVAAALALPLTAAAPASAQWGVNGCGYGYWDIGRLYGVLANNVPYYAAFPPVYYSQPVPRTYGYSPFAYPPGYATPEVIAPEPMSINNPYYQGDVQLTDEASAPADQTTRAARPVEPLAINNPFVFAPNKPLLQAAALR